MTNGTFLNWQSERQLETCNSIQNTDVVEE